MLQRPAHEHGDTRRQLLLRRHGIDQQPDFVRVRAVIRLERAHHGVAAVDAEVELDAFRSQAKARFRTIARVREQRIERVDHDRVANADDHDAAKADASPRLRA